MTQPIKPTPPIDVCLVLEGTYPYVLGGVASWVHQLIVGLPEVRFGLISLLPDSESPRVDRYTVPANVVYRQDVPIFGPGSKRAIAREPNRALVDAVTGFHNTSGAARCPFFRQIDKLVREGRHTTASLLGSRAAWDLLTAFYRTRNRSVPWMDYFWTWRAVHTPLLRMMEVELPQAAVYHTLSTGYAGMLAALAKIRHGSRVAVTEHGLFSREREMEIFMADWIYRAPAGRANEAHERFFKGWWREKFKAMCDLTYDHADQLVTLHDVNRRIQLGAGAPASKLAVVPNGIYPSAYRELRRARNWQDRPFRVGFIGRVVPIKDVKTFLRSVALAGHEMPLEAYILGPTDEAPEYYAECHALAMALGLDGRVHFTGRVDVRSWLKELDVVVLTSVSESQPLVILEAHAAGVPCIATDVGACREMLEGGSEEDAALGPSGLVTPPASPEATARALMQMASDPQAHAAMAEAGIERVERYYRQDDVYAFYRTLYAELAAREAYAPLAGRDRRVA